MSRMTGLAGKILSRTQMSLLVMSVLLLAALGSVAVIAYININTASAFQAGYIIADLAHVQHEVSQLHVETNRLLRVGVRNTAPLENRRRNLDLYIQQAREGVRNNERLVAGLDELSGLLAEYDSTLRRLDQDLLSDRDGMLAYRLELVLGNLTVRAQDLYNQEEILFYKNINLALRLQRTSQSVTLGIGVVLLVIGALLLRSIGQTVSGEFQKTYHRLEVEVSERRRAEEELRRQNEYLAAIYHADAELYRHLELDQVLQSLVDVAIEILGVDKSALFVWDAPSQGLTVRAARGFAPVTLAQVGATFESNLVGHVARTGQPVTVEDCVRDMRVSRQLVEAENLRSFMHIPLEVEGSIFGVFSVAYTTPHAFRGEERRLLFALAQRTALAIENAHLYSQAQRAATLEERQRIARELHDAVMQTLFSARMIADVLPRLWRINTEEGLRRLDELRDLTRGAMAEMRTLLLELRPAALLETPLDDLLYQLGEATSGRARLPVRVTVEGRCDLPADVKVVFYRVAQEALNNVIKHANAGAAHVSVRAIENVGVEMCISDDGLGFDTMQRFPDHLGLAIMRERAASVDAILRIESQPGSGTSVELTWQADVPGQEV